jgi:hypothetical protein
MAHVHKARMRLVLIMEVVRVMAHATEITFAILPVTKLQTRA